MSEPRPLAGPEPVLTGRGLAKRFGAAVALDGVDLAFAQRTRADSWRHPGKADADPVMIEALATDRVRGKPITVVDLAALKPDAPAPPGMPRFPGPGETRTSPPHSPG